MTSVLPPRLAERLFGIVVSLVGAGIVSAMIETQALIVPKGKAFSNLFNLNAENNVPAWFSSAILLTVAIYAYLIAQQETAHTRKHRKLWLLLAVLFVLLSMDETIALHEMAGGILERHTGQLTGVLRFAWVIPGVIFCAVVGGLFIRFVWDLPAGIRGQVVAAGLIYVSGALGMEMVDGAIYARFGHSALYVALTILEETFEMCGTVLCIRGFSAMLYDAAPQLFTVPREAAPFAGPAAPMGVDRAIA
jgi:hypothetical protein